MFSSERCLLNMLATLQKDAAYSAPDIWPSTSDRDFNTLAKAQIMGLFKR
jgi:hypothetical protein